MITIFSHIIIHTKILQSCNYFNVFVDCDCFWRVGIPDVEPWTLSGGFLADLQKLLYSSANLADLFLLKTVLPLSLNCYTVRPYVDEDTVCFYFYFSFLKKDNFIKFVVHHVSHSFFIYFFVVLRRLL